MLKNLYDMVPNVNPLVPVILIYDALFLGVKLKAFFDFYIKVFRKIRTMIIVYNLFFKKKNQNNNLQD